MLIDILWIINDRKQIAAEWLHEKPNRSLAAKLPLFIFSWAAVVAQR